MDGFMVFSGLLAHERFSEVLWFVRTTAKVHVGRWKDGNFIIIVQGVFEEGVHIQRESKTPWRHFEFISYPSTGIPDSRTWLKSLKPHLFPAPLRLLPEESHSFSE